MVKPVPEWMRATAAELSASERQTVSLAFNRYPKRAAVLMTARFGGATGTAREFAHGMHAIALRLLNEATEKPS